MTQLPDLVHQIANKLKQNQAYLATAESCTGGLIASALTDISGSSAWFDRGYVTYSNLAKQDMLFVSEALIKSHGAVSEEVAVAMAEGALKHSASHVSLSVTGIAGPDGGTACKPVGTVCFAWSSLQKSTHTRTYHFSGNRQEIRLAACEYALETLLQYLENNKV